ncbi:MAG: hypothetical protein R3F17_02675 [Planctomycetota bacterium]
MKQLAALQRLVRPDLSAEAGFRCCSRVPVQAGRLNTESPAT